MSRFNEFNYDKEKWKLIIEEYLDEQYYGDVGHKKHFSLRNLSTNQEYHLSTSVCYDKLVSDNVYTGLEQISDNKFIEYYHHQDRYELREYYFDEKGTMSLERYYGSGLVSLDDDKIWLKNWQIYSISEGCMIETLKTFDRTGTEISLKANSDGKNFLYCKMPLSSDVDGTDYLLFVFDAETLLPALPAFSSLRGDKFIELSDDFTFADLIKEEKKYKDYISSYIESFGKDSVMNAEQVLLSGLVDKA